MQPWLGRGSAGEDGANQNRNSNPNANRDPNPNPNPNPEPNPEPNQEWMTKTGLVVMPPDMRLRDAGAPHTPYPHPYPKNP